MIAIMLFLLWGSAQADAPAVYSRDAEANALFLQARELYKRSDPRVAGGKLANAKEAIKLYELAVKKDPTFALAYVELSRAWLQLGYSDPDGLSSDQIIPPARAALLEAVRLDSKLAEAHRGLANLYYSADYDWEKADHEYRLVLELAPSNPTNHVAYAGYLASMGRFDEALAHAREAERLAPSVLTEITLGRIYYSMRRYDEAADFCKQSLSRQDNALGHFFLGFVDVAQKKYDEAIAQFKTGADFSNNGGANAGLAYGYAMAGRRDEALRILDELKSSTKRGLIVPYRVAAVYVALGDHDQAIDWLVKEYETRGNWATQLKVDPVMDPLRSEPRFKELVRRMKFNG